MIETSKHGLNKRGGLFLGFMQNRRASRTGLKRETVFEDLFMLQKNFENWF